MTATLGRYELIAEIGSGGMADVKLALQRGPAGFEKLVVLKLVHEELASQKAVVDMLLAEAKLAALIKHPNVVDVYELGEADGRYFIAMEYLEGEPLLSVLDHGHAGKRLDPLSMARIVADAAEGLEAAHGLKSLDGKPLGVVHHDISQGNIFVLNSGQVKLLDFGVAKIQKLRSRAASEAEATPEKAAPVFGKLAYMAPEKLDERPGDRRSDIWSLGCVLWEALTFKRLFKGANAVELVREVRYVNVTPPSQVNPEVPPALDAVVLKALQRDPLRRYQRAHDMAAAIEEVLSARGYPSKNFQIAAFMMAAFSDRIAARESLLREISGSSRPSSEVIDAAFGEAPVRAASQPTFEKLIESAGGVTLPEGHTGADVMRPVTMHVDDVEELDEPVTATAEDGGSASAPVSPATHPTADPSWHRSKHGDSLRQLQKRAQERRENPGAVRRRQAIPYAIGGAIALVAAIVAIMQCNGREPAAVVAETPPATVAAAAPTHEDVPPQADATVPVDASEPPAAVQEPDEEGVVDEIEMPPEIAPGPTEPAPKARPKGDARKLYARGLAAWNKRQLGKAYDLFTEGRRVNPRYAPNWYGIALVHEKQGRKGAAKSAYQRYLALDPKAPNAKQLREHIKKRL